MLLFIDFLRVLEMAGNIYNLFQSGYISIFLSIFSITICIVVTILSFYKNGRHIFKWKIVQRFVVVSCLCDALFYIEQAAFGIQVLITDKISEPGVCTFYDVFLLVVAYAQCRLSIIVTLTASVLFLTKRHITLGKYDWQMFSFIGNQERTIQSHRNIGYTRHMMKTNKAKH